MANGNGNHHRRRRRRRRAAGGRVDSSAVVCGGGDRGLSVADEKALFLEFELYVLIPT